MMRMSVYVYFTVIWIDYVEIISRMEMLISDVSTLLNVNYDTSEILLQRFQWSKERLMDSFFSDPDAVLVDCGLDLYNAAVLSSRLRNHHHHHHHRRTTYEQHEHEHEETSSEQHTMHMRIEININISCKECFCSICYSNFDSDCEGFALGCDHWFCSICYGKFLRTEIFSGPACIKVN